MITIEDIKEINRQIIENLLEIRHYLHANPDLSFQEENTQRYILNQLEINNIECHKIADTGVIGIIEGDRQGKTIALRADIDALPVKETTGLDFSSKNEGVMHACGHDVHTTTAIGAAIILSRLKKKLSGKIVIIFQPAEEKLPGGAIKVISGSMYKKMKPDIVIAQHVEPSLPVGKIGFRAGKYMASTDEIYLKVIGKGGHAAMPHLLNDPVYAASQIVVGLQQIVSRRAPAQIPTVFSFGKMIANGATNIIPDEVNLEGTIRTFDEEWRKRALEEIRSAAESIAESCSCRCEVNIVNGYPALVNHEETTNQAMKFASQYVGDNNIDLLDIRMTAEDFSYFAQDTKAFMYRLGTGGTPETSYPLHSPRFCINESVFEHSSGLMAWLAASFCR